MVGQLQIISYFLCVYLLFKAVEILQIALMSPRQDRNAGMAIGVLAIVAAIFAGAVFLYWMELHVTSIGKSGR
jgi:uncharacterized membrane protein YgdD (TMEM256/DUF423 family)